MNDSADAAAVEQAVLGVPGVVSVRSDIVVAGRSNHPASSAAHDSR